MKKNYITIGVILLAAVLAGGLYLINQQNQKNIIIDTPIESQSISPPLGSSSLGVFEGRTPCQDFLVRFTKSFVESPLGCERVKWLITFYQDEETSKPTHYVFGIQGRDDSHQGTWQIINGTVLNSDAAIYQLRPDGNDQVISLLKVGDNHLFFLDENMNLLVGSKNLSYTLSKTANSYETRKSPLNSE